MNLDLQTITDDLGSRLGRSVTVDDPQMNLLAYSPHYGPVDDSRRDFILRRVAPAPILRWVMSLGIAKDLRPRSVPANPELGTLARLCIPLLHRGVRLGYLWLINADESLTPEEVTIATAAADAASAVLYRESMVVRLERGRERELMRDLFSDRLDVRRMAAVQLVDEELFADSGPVFVVVVRCVDMLHDEALRLAFDTALTQTRWKLPSRHAIHLTRPDHGILLVSAKERQSTALAQVELAAVIIADLKRSGVVAPRIPSIGIGDCQDDLVDAKVSLDEAQSAAHVAEVVGTMGGVARWQDLGVYRTLARLPADDLTARSLDPAIAKLMEADKGGTLLRTLECFLDNAGYTNRAAEQLSLHRTSLYYRLDKIRQITGLDLEDGNHRLALHLGIKLVRLAGVHPDERSVQQTIS